MIRLLIVDDHPVVRTGLQGMLSGEDDFEVVGEARGAANKEVARTLFISETTVKTHLSHIFTKLGVDDRTAAVTVALNRGILRMPS